MRASKALQIIIPLAVLAVATVGFVTYFGIGTLSAMGWSDIALMCPLGSLMILLSEKTIVPRAIWSLIIVVILILIFARAFCGWVCPVPVISKLRKLATKKSSNLDLLGKGALDPKMAMAATDAYKQERAGKPLTEKEKAALKGCSDCHNCVPRRHFFDSRHVILGGALLSAAIFGFPVFCLVCPIGLTFATILLVIRLFAYGDLTWSVLIVPVVLLIEVVFFRKWCSHICPISALMSLVGKGNRTFVPKINDSICLETSKHTSCEVCSQSCPEGINPRHPEAGAYWSECTKCRACVDNCPTHAIKMPFIPRRNPQVSDDLTPAGGGGTGGGGTGGGGSSRKPQPTTMQALSDSEVIINPELIN
ncbi:MAG: 4Fe-4S binding protein [Eggerthellaceae bacterium]|nr:4Fe-4S binding protein [Eggerthellaceae bacterium]